MKSEQNGKRCTGSLHQLVLFSLNMAKDVLQVRNLITITLESFEKCENLLSFSG